MRGLEEITSPEDLSPYVSGDPFLAWAAGELGERARAWVYEGAVALAAPNLSRRDRLATGGNPTAVVPLVRTVLEYLPTSYRPVGDAKIIRRLVQELPTLELVAEFGWMDVDAAAFVGTSTDARWLGDDDLTAVAPLLNLAAPDAYAQPGEDGVRRWAGVRAPDGALQSVVADAWSAPTVGFVAGLATHPDHRRRGAARSVTTFAVRQLLEDHRSVGLFVDSSNEPAIGLYGSLGMRWRDVAAARRVPEVATFGAPVSLQQR